MITTSLYAEAYKYSEVWGFSIIPVGKDKRPLFEWKQYQTKKATAELIKNWWEKWPNANIGIVTGKISGITVIDVDTYKGGDPKPFPKTFTVQTGNKGIQLYYKYYEHIQNSAEGFKNMPGVDIRNDGGYVVASPSVTNYVDKKTNKKAGGQYTIIHNDEFSDFPTDLFTVKNKKKSFTDLISIQSGSRNSSMASVIGTLIYPMEEKKIMTEGWSAVVAINKTYTPPLPEKELATTFKSIVEKELSRRADSSLATESPIQISTTERITIKLRKNGNGVPYKDMTNAILVLSQHPDTAGKLKYNEFKHDIEFNKKAVEESDLLDFVHLLQNSGLPGVSKDIVQSALQRYAYQNRYDEAQDWLKTLKWDGTHRLNTWLIEATGIENTNYHQAIGAQWFRGLVSRLSYPGCIFDYVLVIVGPQGVGKTSLFRILGGEWYKSFTGTVENKDFFLQLRGAAILDLDEGVALYKSESIKMKSIITQVQDEYRAPYDRMMKKYPRRFVFSMSTNDTEPFRDMTGNRRYWPVSIKNPVNFKWLEENREQLYAEAYHALINKIELPEVPLEEALEQQENYLPNDEWETPIMDYIKKSYDYCIGSPNYFITVNEIFKSVLGQEQLEKLEKKQAMRIGTILRQNGFERRRLRADGQRIYKYCLTNDRLKSLKEFPLVLSKEEFDKRRVDENEQKEAEKNNW